LWFQYLQPIEKYHLHWFAGTIQIRLTSVSQQLPKMRANLEHHQKILFNRQELYNAGLSNLIDLESTKHDVLSAEMALQDIEYEKVRAWIALYRAAGGSWT
jgi:outer membrane protein TolC